MLSVYYIHIFFLSLIVRIKLPFEEINMNIFRWLPRFLKEAFKKRRRSLRCQKPERFYFTIYLQIETKISECQSVMKLRGVCTKATWPVSPLSCPADFPLSFFSRRIASPPEWRLFSHTFSLHSPVFPSVSRHQSRSVCLIPRLGPTATSFVHVFYLPDVSTLARHSIPPSLLYWKFYLPFYFLTGKSVLAVRRMKLTP